MIIEHEEQEQHQEHAEVQDSTILRALVDCKSSAIGYSDELGKKRRLLMKYYDMEPFGDEVAGRSRYISSDVSDVVEGMTPSLLRIFTQGREVFRFDPETSAQTEECRQKTDLVNHVFFNQNQGVLVLNNMIKDGLLQYCGVVKVYWDETQEVTEEYYEGLSELEYAAIQDDEHSEVLNTVAIDQDGLTAYNVTLRVTSTSGKVCYANIPPEEFLILKDSRDFVDPMFIAHRTLKTRSELVAMGFDKDLVYSLPSDEQEEELAQERNKDLNGLSENPTGFKSNDKIYLTEAYIKLDVDDDGISELWQVFEAGNKILERNITDCHPFACVTPIPKSHRAIGTCPAAQVADIQYTKSTLIRNALDNIYTANYQRIAYNDRVNQDDLLTVGPGTTVHVEGEGPISESLFPIPSTPQVQQILQQVEFIDASAEKRTGYTRFAQGLDADTLNKTATGFRGINQNSRERVEGIARIYAETGIKDIGVKTANLLCKYQSSPMEIQVTGKPLTINPTDWRYNVGCRAYTGLGTGDKAEKLNNLNYLLQKQIEAIEKGSVLSDHTKVYNTLDRIIQEIGLDDVDLYFNDPRSPQETLAAEHAQLVQMVKQLQEQLQSVSSDLTKAEQIKAEAQLIKSQNDNQLGMIKEQNKVQIELLKLQQRDEEFAVNTAKDFTKLELDARYSKYPDQGDIDVPNSVV